MNCNTCDELRRYGYSNNSTTIIEKGVAITSYRGYEVRFKKQIVKCEECGELWTFEYNDGTYPSLFSSLNKIFEKEYEENPSKWGGAEYVDKVLNEIVINTPIAIKE